MAFRWVSLCKSGLPMILPFVRPKRGCVLSPFQFHIGWIVSITSSESDFKTSIRNLVAFLSWPIGSCRYIFVFFNAKMHEISFSMQRAAYVAVCALAFRITFNRFNQPDRSDRNQVFNVFTRVQTLTIWATRHKLCSISIFRAWLSPSAINRKYFFSSSGTTAGERRYFYIGNKQNHFFQKHCQRCQYSRHSVHPFRPFAYN